MKIKLKNGRVKSTASNQSGAAVVVAIFFLLFVTVVVTASVINRVREGRAHDMSRTQLEETWEARSAAAVLTRVTKVRLPEKYLQDIALAKSCPGVDPDLESFDSQNQVAEVSPAVIIQPENGTIQCNEEVSAANYTSLFGAAAEYLTNRRSYLEEQAAALGFSQERARIFSIEESVRRFSPSAEPAYQIHFIVDGRGGRYGQVRVEDDVILGSLSSNCGTTASLKADRSRVIDGESVTLTITYSMATHLKVYETAGGTVIREADVGEDANPQDYTFSYTPAGANSYRVAATGSTAGCASQSGSVIVDVTTGSCAVNPPLIAVFSASSLQVNPGEEIVLQWQTGGGLSGVTLNGSAVNPNDSNYRMVVNADTTFSLLAKGNDPGSNCPAQKDINVRVNTSDCVLQTPTVAFSSDNTSVQVGQSFTLSWNIGGLDSAGQITFSEPDGSTHSSAVSGSDNRTINAAGTYIYKIAGINKCPDSTEKTTEKIVTMTVSNSCPPPVINSLTATPSTVYTGANQSVRLDWNIGGTKDSVNIGGVGNVSGNYIYIPQPQTTKTYTMTVTGCNQTKTAQVVVNVVSSPPPPTSSLRLLTYTVSSNETTPDPGNDTCRVDARSYSVNSIPTYTDNGNGTVTVKTSYPVGARFTSDQASLTSFGFAWILTDSNTNAALQNGGLPFPDTTLAGEFTVSKFGRNLSRLRLKMILSYDNGIFGTTSRDCSGEQYNYDADFAFQ